MFCDTPGQSVVAAVVGGIVGGLAGVALGFGIVGVVLLAGALGGIGDFGAHLLRKDKQYCDAVEQVQG